METRTDEIAERIYRFSTFVPEIGPTGFTFNQYLIDDEQPLLFHTGLRHMFPLLADAIAAVTPLEGLRWITFGHLEADESGAMNDLLGAAPHAEVAHGMRSAAWCRSTTWLIVRPCRWPTARSSSWANTG